MCLKKVNFFQASFSLASRIRGVPSWCHTCKGQQQQQQQQQQEGRQQVHLHIASFKTVSSTCTLIDRHSRRSRSHHFLDDPKDTPGRRKGLVKGSEKADSSAAMRTLQDLFGLSEGEAQHVLLSCHSASSTKRDVLQNLELLHGCGIAGTQIYRIPWILSHKPDVLSQKLVKLKEPHLFHHHHEGLGFCFLPLEKMHTYHRHFLAEAPAFPHHPNRIYYLAQRIKVPVELFTEKIGKPHKTLSMNIHRLDSMIDLFHKYGLSPEDVVADLWVFGYSIQKAEKRLQRATDLGCTELRPWMCRCSDKIFDRFLERYQCGKELMGEHESLFGYLSERLQCDQSVLEKAFRSNMVMGRVHISKFSRIIDLLLDEGITTQEIQSCMKVFQFSEERMAARIKELKRIGFFPFPLILLIRTPAQFKEVVKQYRKRFKSVGVRKTQE